MSQCSAGVGWRRLKPGNGSPKITSALVVDKWIRFNSKEGVGQRTDVNPATKSPWTENSIEQASEYYRYFEALRTLVTIVPLRALKRHAYR